MLQRIFNLKENMAMENVLTEPKVCLTFGESKAPCAIVDGICISVGGIPKKGVSSVRIFLKGLEGDGHHHEKHNRPAQAVCFQDAEVLEELSREGFSLVSGTIGENLTVRNMNVQRMAVGTILKFSGGVVLQLTKERHPCYVLDAIDPHLKDAIKGRCGFYAQVLREGTLKVGETIRVKTP